MDPNTDTYETSRSISALASRLAIQGPRCAKTFKWTSPKTIDGELDQTGHHRLNVVSTKMKLRLLVDDPVIGHAVYIGQNGVYYFCAVSVTEPMQFTRLDVELLSLPAVQCLHETVEQRIDRIK